MGKRPSLSTFWCPGSWRLSISEAKEGVGGTKSRNTPTKSERSEQAPFLGLVAFQGLGACSLPRTRKGLEGRSPGTPRRRPRGMSKLITSRSFAFRSSLSLLIPEVKEGVGGTKSRNTPTKSERSGSCSLPRTCCFSGTWSLFTSEDEEGAGRMAFRAAPGTDRTLLAWPT